MHPKSQPQNVQQSMKLPILVTGNFDNLQAAQVRFLEEAARYGPVHALLWDDPAARFTLAERKYFLKAIRHVDKVTVRALNPLMTEKELLPVGIWTWPFWEDSPERLGFCAQQGILCRVIPPEAIQGYPPDAIEHTEPDAAGKKKVIVTGCFDYIHTGHVRFFEEASAYGDLYVIVGADTNVRLLKGEGHPLFPQDQRRYMAGAIRFVKAALISTGRGWMDAAPEIERLKPDIYLVNDDGDKPEKRQFCAENGLEYIVLERRPAPGLPPRSSTDLRGF